MNVYQKLNEARSKFHSLQLKKTGHNKFAGYNYFELGDFLIPALQVFRDAGLCAVVSFEKETASMTIFDADKPESSLVISSPMGSAALKGCHEVQNIGAVETYQRRYLWVAALEIVEHDALDSSEPVKAEPSKKRTGVMADVLQHTAPLPDEQQTYIAELAVNVIDLFGAKGRTIAYDRVQSEQLDNEQMLYLWAQLPSNVRTGLKAEKTSRETTKEPA